MPTTSSAPGSRKSTASTDLSSPPNTKCNSGLAGSWFCIAWFMVSLRALNGLQQGTLRTFVAVSQVTDRVFGRFCAEYGHRSNPKFTLKFKRNGTLSSYVVQDGWTQENSCSKSLQLRRVAARMGPLSAPSSCDELIRRALPTSGEACRPSQRHIGDQAQKNSNSDIAIGFEASQAVRRVAGI